MTDTTPDPLGYSLATTAVENLLSEGETVRYFYTTNRPHAWSSGPTIHYFDDSTEGYGYIASLERAQELAEEKKAGRPGYEDYVQTSYGLMIENR